MANKVLLKKSSTAAKVPLTSDLDYGELALNYADGKLYYKTSTNTISSFQSDVSSFVTLTGTQTLTNKTLTSPAISGGTINNAIIGGTTAAAGSFTTLAASSTITATGDVLGQYLRSTNSTGDEGGEILLYKPATNSTIAGTGVTIDVWQNRFRIFEQGGTARGVYIDITAAGAGVGSEFTTNNNTQTLTNKTLSAAVLTGTLTAGGGVGTSGQVLSSTGTGVQWVAGGGSVTSVALSLPSIFTVTGSPVTTTGTLTATLASQTANTFLAAPNGSAGAPTMRAIVAADIPTLNQNTTGSAATLTTARTINGTSFNGSANITVTANTTNALTIGTGLSGTSFNGSGAVTITIDSTVTTLTGTQTLTNKTIAAGSNTISGLTNSNLSGTAGITNANLANSSVTVGSTAIALGASATTIAGLTSVTSTTFVGALTGAATSVVNTVAGTASAELVRGNMGDNDQARILVGATATNAGFLEIATADDGTEPIHVRQYTGVFTTLARTATLLDASGNTSFPGTLTATTFSGAGTSLTGTATSLSIGGNAATATSAATLTTGRTIAITGDLAYTSGSFNGSANVTGTGTLATVNSNVGSFTNASVTVNAKGLVTAASSGTAPVTSVTGTAPIVSSGGVTPAISISAATTSAAGSMSSADKTKLDGIATNATANTGTVTSVGGTGTVSGLTLTGTVTTTGNLTLGGTLSVNASNFASQTANTVLAAPNGSNGVPTFRTLVAADVPTLNQNTTGSAATLTTARTINTVSFNGSANIVVEPFVESDESTNATRYITFVDSSTDGHQRLNEKSNFTINPSTGTVITPGAFASTFALNKNTIDVSYSIPSGYNAVAAGPVVINNGITVTIPDGSTWVIV
jgi:hypothetical protein